LIPSSRNTFSCRANAEPSTRPTYTGEEEDKRSTILSHGWHFSINGLKACAAGGTRTSCWPAPREC
jgi:hypothetical protein